MHHFFVDPAQVMGDFIRITGPDVNHMKNALRMKQGEEVLVSDGTGTDYHCCLSSLNSDCVEARIVSADRDGRELPSRIWLFQGLPKSDKMEFIIQKNSPCLWLIRMVLCDIHFKIIEIVGLDLKEDVIEKCSVLAKKYGYEKLTFCQGDIASYEGVDRVDMVVTLHACDTATDYALAKAVGWGASVILSVPCCQHELNRQIENDILAPVLGYGILKERFAAILTDGLRAQILESAGYDTQILEFIDMEHTPKNILIRAVKGRGKKDTGIQRLTEELQVHTTLQKLFEQTES